MLVRHYYIYVQLVRMKGSNWLFIEKYLPKIKEWLQLIFLTELTEDIECILNEWIFPECISSSGIFAKKIAECPFQIQIELGYQFYSK